MCLSVLCIKKRFDLRLREDIENVYICASDCVVVLGVDGCAAGSFFGGKAVIGECQDDNAGVDGSVVCVGIDLDRTQQCLQR